MRLAVCALSAVLLSGCSWLGLGGNSTGYNGAGVYGANCGGGYGASNAYNMGNMGSMGGGGGCGGAGGYGVAGNGYGAGYGAGAGYGTAGYGAGAGYGSTGYGAGYGAGATGYGAGYGTAGYGAGAGGYGAGASGYGVSGYGGATGYGAGYGATGATGYNAAALGLGAAGAYGASGYGASGYGATTLGANAPYGAAVGGAYGGGAYGAQYGTQGNVTTVAGAPIYVPQPYPSYYGVPQLRGVPVAVAGGGAMPFGIEAGIGTNFFQNGDILSGEAAKGNVSAINAIAYKDAFDNGTSYDMATTYDLNRNTTVLGRLGYNKADGKKVKAGSVHSGSVTEDLYAEFSDMEQVTIEGGLRRYLGGWTNPNGGFRPYVGAMGGFTHTDDINITQSSATLIDPKLFTQQYVDGGWSPTAAGLIGAEWQVGGTTAIGVETGIRWTDGLDTNLKSSDAVSIPVRLRGRVSF